MGPAVFSSQKSTLFRLIKSTGQSFGLLWAQLLTLYETIASKVAWHVQSPHSEAKFIDPWLGDIVDSDIRLSYRPASLCSLAGRYDNPMSETQSQLYPPIQGLRIWLLVYSLSRRIKPVFAAFLTTEKAILDQSSPVPHVLNLNCLHCNENPTYVFLFPRSSHIFPAAE